MFVRFYTHTEDDTSKRACSLARATFAGCTIALEGALGVGKTRFVQSFAQALGVRQAVRSPTFSLVHEYTEIVPPLVHMDMYRMRSEREAWDFAHYFDGEAVCIVEWASRIKGLLPEHRLDIAIAYAQEGGEEARVWTCEARGARYAVLLDAMRLDGGV
jgi:tRNA threonylcarbamoyladenosine biosynthesis protein TsaE